MHSSMLNTPSVLTPKSSRKLNWARVTENLKGKSVHLLAACHPVNLNHTAIRNLLSPTMRTMALVANVIVGILQILSSGLTMWATNKKPTISTAGSSVGRAGTS